MNLQICIYTINRSSNCRNHPGTNFYIHHCKDSCHRSYHYSSNIRIDWMGNSYYMGTILNLLTQITVIDHN